MLADSSSPSRVRDLFPGAEYLPAGCDPEFTSVCRVASEVLPGDLYVHLDEFDSSGARLAVERGAAVVVAERLLPEIDAPLVVVEDCRVASRLLSSTGTHHDARLPRVIAVAGSTGGDRVATLLASIHALSGAGVGLLTSRVIDDGEHAIRRAGGSRIGLSDWLRRCQLGDVPTAIAHASPADSLTRRADVVCLSTLRCDGLDAAGVPRWQSSLHQREAILQAAGSLAPETTLVANVDDPDVMAIASAHSGKLVTFGEAPHADVSATVAAEGAEFVVSYGADSACVTAPAPGRAARRDCLAAIATALADGFDLRDAVAGIGLAPKSALLAEAVSFGQPFSITLDQAIRPIELADALDAARPAQGRLLLTLRLARDRGVAQRQLATAARMADRVFASGELAGIETPSDRVTLVEDRSTAIAVAIGLADPGDAVLVAGCRERTNEDGVWECPERRVIQRLVQRRLAYGDGRAAA